MTLALLIWALMPELFFGVDVLSLCLKVLFYEFGTNIEAKLSFKNIFSQLY